MFLPAGYRIDVFPNTITITTPDGTTTESTDSFGSATTYGSLSVLRIMLGPPPLVTKRADENQGDEVGLNLPHQSLRINIKARPF